jgi:ATP-dependent DNA helicase DinG
LIFAKCGKIELNHTVRLNLHNNIDMFLSKSLFEEGGAIADKLPGYKIRPQQLQMVEAVEEAINGPGNLIVEAGTGVGKSLAYLIPFINWAVREGKRAVVSTYTKALQNQLFIKDLPFLRQVLDLEFRYAICMGSENYVCLRKANKNFAPDAFKTKKQKKYFENIIKWISKTESGLVTDMDFVPDGVVWSKFSRESDLCLGRKCPHKDRCFYRKARRQQAAAHILVTNHSLLFADMVSEVRGLLPDFQGLVLDEAHTLEDVATGYFGKAASNTGLRYLIDGVCGLVSGNGTGSVSRDGVTEKVNEIKGWIKELQESSVVFFKEVETVFGQEDRTVQFDRGQFSAEKIMESMEALSASLRKISDVLEGIEVREEARTYAQRCDRFSQSLDFIFRHRNEDYVYWLDVRTRKSGTNYSFHAAPIDISEQMRAYLFERICPIVLTSATLSLSEEKPDFSFIKGRLGLDDPLELTLGSPFDYESNVLIYLPRGIADPNRDFGSYKRQVQEDIVRIYDIMGGRIFALFTSYEMLNTAADGIAAEREDINILKQGDLPRYVLLDVFKKNHNSILMGTTTFWQGVDVPGSSLECVIITKLPFSVPNDPINAARIRAIRDRGLNPFGEYQIPQAIIMFKQGFGRLIRNYSDRGVVAVLDPRVRTRYYGKKFIDALPKCRQTDDLREVKDFFQLTSQ